MKRTALLIALCLTTAWTCFGQGARGLVTGVVTDSSGAVIPDASLRATNRASNVTTPGKTNSEGNYAIDFLPPGDYTIAVQKKEALANDVIASWRKLFATQEPLLRWPEEVEGKFREWGRQYPAGVDAGKVTDTLNDYATFYPNFLTPVYLLAVKS